MAMEYAMSGRCSVYSSILHELAGKKNLEVKHQAGWKYRWAYLHCYSAERLYQHCKVLFVYD